MSEERIQQTGDPSAALRLEDLLEGSGEGARRGQQVEVHYGCWLYDPREPDHKGKKLDGTDQHGNVPFSFRLGSGQVIRGWDQGVEGMKAGGRRRLVVPPALGYGPHGAAGVIPPGATLLFEIELLAAHL
ncbi:MAG TPA: FKBP-type peptidyl-prolyl cis-trans isomerase [Thermoanaerobaculia bacterium]|jgi:FKBP-type peptidyl-prolyl cis-trans isomerase|nr:FKBP-type peptidyl-prolyl cis-trans isomerase [Thermoanaerobaculia bacterium]